MTISDLAMSDSVLDSSAALAEMRASKRREAGMAEFAVVELAAALGMSLEAGHAFLGDAIELGYRLPRILAEVWAGRVPVWRARRIARHTGSLPPEGAAWVDEQVAPVLDGALSTGRLEAVLDVGDALELDAILADLATDLATAGDTSPLDVSRAKALGRLARGDLPERADDDHSGDSDSRRRRRVVLHVQLTDTALHGCGDGIATLTTPTGRPLGPVTVEQVQDWCADPGAEITVKPVIDLLALLASTGYQPSATLRDLVVALHLTCAFPHCERPAANLAPLCRRHHSAKTHDTWTYTRLAPAEHLWTSPHGYQFIKDRHTTRDVSGDLDAHRDAGCAGADGTQTTGVARSTTARRSPPSSIP